MEERKLVDIKAENSEEFKDIAAALAKAQGDMDNAEKSATNLHFKNTYATLGDVMNACREPLSKNGLAFVQMPVRLDEQWFLKTILTHISGQFYSSLTPMLLDKTNSQGFGMALTYARRQGLTAMIGMAQEDDDGNETSKSGDESKPASAASQPKKKDQTIPPNVTDAQVNRLYAIAKARNWDEAMLNDVKVAMQVTKWRDLSKDQYDWVCDCIDKGHQPEQMVAVINSQKVG